VHLSDRILATLHSYARLSQSCHEDNQPIVMDIHHVIEDAKAMRIGGILLGI
jgi:imidazoleglycerol phosphate dehydratase HisB